MARLAAGPNAGFENGVTATRIVIDRQCTLQRHIGTEMSARFHRSVPLQVDVERPTPDKCLVVRCPVNRPSHSLTFASAEYSGSFTCNAPRTGRITSKRVVQIALPPSTQKSGSPALNPIHQLQLAAIPHLQIISPTRATFNSGQRTLLKIGSPIRTLNICRRSRDASDSALFCAAAFANAEPLFS